MSNTPETNRALNALHIVAETSGYTKLLLTTLAADMSTLETQRDEARAEVERLRKALDAGPCDCDGRYLCERCHILGKKPPTVATTDTSPEIFEAHGLEWYRHDGSERCPCEGGLDKVDLLYKPPGVTVEKGIGVKEVIWENKGFSESLHIIGWRPADAPEKLARKGGEG